MLHGWSCYYAHVWRTLAEQEERETDLGTGNINGSRNTQKEFSLVAVLHQPSKHHRSLKLPLQRMFVSFQIILESRISDKWYTFRSESTILEYFKFCKPFLKPSPPKTSSSTHLSCFTNYKLLHKERLLDVQNHPFFMVHPHTLLHIQWPPHSVVLQCPLFSSLPPGSESTGGHLKSQSQPWNCEIRSNAMPKLSLGTKESSPYWRRKAALYSKPWWVERGCGIK